MQVSSFGVNGHVKLPGASQREPNVYDFGTPYAAMYEDLQRKDEALYTRKGLLQARQHAEQHLEPAAGVMSHACTASHASVLPPA